MFFYMSRLIKQSPIYTKRSKKKRNGIPYNNLTELNIYLNFNDDLFGLNLRTPTRANCKT